MFNSVPSFLWNLVKLFVSSALFPYYLWLIANPIQSDVSPMTLLFVINLSKFQKRTLKVISDEEINYTENLLQKILNNIYVPL